MNDVKLVSVLYYFSVSFFANLVTTSGPKYTPFTYPRLYQIADRRVGMDYFAKKLGVEGFMYDHLILRRTKPFIEWMDEFEVLKEAVRNIDTCSLKKTTNRTRAQDTVGTLGTRECFKQCQMENKEFYQFLNGKLQKLITGKSFKAEVRLTDFPVRNASDTPADYYSCVRQGYKKYTCECTYSKYVIEATENFKKTFAEFVEDLYGLSPSPASAKMLEERYRMPLKLIAFLICCHLLPSSEVLSFLVWWDTVENPLPYTTTMSLPTPLKNLKTSSNKRRKEKIEISKTESKEENEE